LAPLEEAFNELNVALSRDAAGPAIRICQRLLWRQGDQSNIRVSAYTCSATHPHPPTPTGTWIPTCGPARALRNGRRMPSGIAATLVACWTAQRLPACALCLCRAESIFIVSTARQHTHHTLLTSFCRLQFERSGSARAPPDAPRNGAQIGVTWHGPSTRWRRPHAAAFDGRPGAQLRARVAGAREHGGAGGALGSGQAMAPARRRCCVRLARPCFVRPGGKGRDACEQCAEVPRVVSFPVCVLAVSP
jgi:hypothetical protein